MRRLLSPEVLQDSSPTKIDKLSRGARGAKIVSSNLATPTKPVIGLFLCLPLRRRDANWIDRSGGEARRIFCHRKTQLLLLKVLHLSVPSVAKQFVSKWTTERRVFASKSEVTQLISPRSYLVLYYYDCALLQSRRD